MTLGLRCARLILATSLALVGFPLCAQDGIEGALSRVRLVAPFESTLAIADFDHDGRPDGAVLRDSGRFRGGDTRTIEIHLTGRPNATLTFESGKAFHDVTARDIDDDGDFDIILACFFTQESLHVWLNDGEGAFQQGRVEDFPASAPAREWLRQPDRRWALGELFLPPQRSSENAILSSRNLAGLLSSAGKVLALPIAILPASSAFAPPPSRAPPFSHSR
jgi:hypothetical protein